jgi:hypothetical protein
MPACANCGLENPPGSRFCAGCGKAMPVALKCAACGAESPQASKFCKACGAVLQAAAATSAQSGPVVPPPPPVRGTTGVTGSAAPRAAAASETLSKLKGILWASIGIIAVALYLNYSQIARMQAFYGQLADTSSSWFLIILDVGLAALSVYAVTQLGKGQLKPAKAAFVANAIVGGVALLLFFKGGIIPIAMNGGLAAISIWGRLLVSREERPLV